MSVDVELIRGLPVLRHAQPSHLRELADLARLRCYQAGDAVYQQHDPALQLYVVLTGRVHLQVDGPNGEVVFLGHLGTGETAGALEVVERRSRMCDALTCEDSELLILPHETFRETLAGSSLMAMGLLSQMSGLMRESSAHFARHRSQDVLGRVCTLLLELTEQCGQDQPDGGRLISRRVTQDDLAMHTGTTRESVNRALQRLRRLQAVRLRGRHLVVVDIPRLESISRA